VKLILKLCAGALLAGFAVCATGCARGGEATNGAAASPAASAPGGAIAGDRGHGKAVYDANCSQCHGATGVEGGIGPSLRDEHRRKDASAAVAWIKDPQPPMPKLYPAVLGEKDVTDVAAYVESL
jgi:mono/diheme cytochrome c family protein